MDAGLDPDGDGRLKIGADDFRMLVMESDYDEGDQIGAPEGSIIVFRLVTYGYGESLSWQELDTMRAPLDAWATEAGTKHGFKHEIRIGANHW